MEHEVDAWIEQLSQCKQLTEADVKRLCDKVCNSSLQQPSSSDLTMLLLCSDAGDFDGRIQCTTRQVSRHRLR